MHCANNSCQCREVCNEKAFKIARGGVLRIEACGGIASGKTTLANLLASLAVMPVLEDFRTNPFWKPFYDDPAGTAFETEITFLLQHYHAVKVSRKQSAQIVCDFSFVLDHAYAHVMLAGRKLEVFERVLQEIQEELAPPDLLIYLRCDPTVELDRIRRRGRNVESSITAEYLAKLNQALDARVQTVRKENVLVIDSAARNFADDDTVRLAVAGEVAERVAS